MLQTVALGTVIGVHTSIRSAKRLELSDSEVLIIVLGGTGCGKSIFVQVATGNKEIEIGHALNGSNFPKLAILS